MSLKTALLAVAALIFTGIALYLWLKVGRTALPPVVLCALIALTCVLKIISGRR